MAKRNILLVGILSIIAFYAPVPFFPNSTLRSLTIEDGPYESVTALLFFFAAMAFLYAFLKARKRNWFFALFALAFLFAAGEEISWGQRIFHFATPAVIEANNAQEEFSIHNLNFLQHEEGIGSSLKGMILNFNRLFILFSVFYCILVPLADKYINRLRALFQRIRLPILSIWFGVLFLVNEIVCKALELFVVKCQSNCPDIYEIKEALWAGFALLWGMYFLFVHVPAKDATPRADVSEGMPLPSTP